MYDYLFKFIVVGDTGVGKSCMMMRFCDDKFDPQHDMTIGVEFGAKNIKVKDKLIKIQIWDTAGQECFRSITKSYYRDSAGAILCYDTTNRASFNGIDKWLTEIKKECPVIPKIMLVGTKTDSVGFRQVSSQEGAALAEKYGLLFVETSSKSNIQIEKCFTDLAEEILNNISSVDINDSRFGIKKGFAGEYGLREESKKDESIDMPVETNNKKCCIIL
jgi:Ras-related protein Rab-2A